MKTTVNKFIYISILILSILLINGFVLIGLSSILKYLNTGADRTSMLHIESQNQTYRPKIKWDLSKNEGRKIELSLLNTIEKDYLNAWKVKNIALQTNRVFGLENYYTEDALQHLLNNIELNKDELITIETTSIRHHPDFEFLSTDGKIASFTDHNVTEYQKYFKDKKLISTQELSSSYKVLLLLEDGFWRIRHMIKIPKSDLPRKNKTLVKAPFQFSQTITVDNKPFTIKGINYYPQKTPWNMFGQEFNSQIIQKDLQLIKSSGLNTIRIFLPYLKLRKASDSVVYMNQLRQLLDIATDNNLKVIPTLFDFFGNYTIQHWTLSHRYAEEIMTAFKNHTAILMWDLKNEPDMDFEIHGKIQVVDWLKQLLIESRKFDPNHPITIGWSNSKDAVTLHNNVDVVSFHYFKNPQNFKRDYAQLRLAVPGKPILLQEFGISSYNGFWNLYGSSLENQKTYHKRMQEILKKEALAFMSWSLYDYNFIPVNVAGTTPWKRRKQKEFGFIDINGIPKPSFLHITY